MFVLTTVADTLRIPPSQFVQSTLSAVHHQIETKYPNRVLLDVGLVICRYGDALRIGDGVLAPGDGGSHHEVLFRLVVFRPFVDEVCLGTVLKADETGITVSIGGWFDDVFIPAHWMLNPSRYDGEKAVWVWSPTYDDDDDEEDDDDGEGDDGEDGGNENGEKKDAGDDGDNDAAAENNENANRFELELGSEIRFRVKSIHFTRITNTAKGVQATTTTSSRKTAPGVGKGGGIGLPSTPEVGRERSLSTASHGTTGGGGDVDDGRPVRRRRSTSVDLTDGKDVPATMRIVGSICEDGLGLTSWWASQEEEEEEEEEYEGEEGQGEEFHEDDEVY